MVDEGVTVVIDLIKSFIPMTHRAIVDNMEKNKNERISKLHKENTERTLEALKTANNGKPVKDKIERYVSKMPIFEFEEGETTDEVGRRMWDMGHSLVISLPDSATPEEVHVLARSIVKSFKNHPCMECREHAIALMEKRYPLVNSETKEDLERQLYEMHNAVNSQVGNPHFSEEDYKKQYGRELA